MTSHARTPADLAPPACPPNHVAYLSTMLSNNAVILHGLANPHCGGFSAFPCGDHHHVGHSSPEVGNRCKAISDEVRAERRGRQ